jgi:hypothetical protein
VSAADDLRALSAAATTGPWDQWGDPGSYVHIWTADERIVARSVLSPDAEFIAWCRNHAAALADLIDAAEALAQPAGWWTGVEHRQEHQLLDRRAVVRDALDALEADRG